MNINKAQKLEQEIFDRLVNHKWVAGRNKIANFIWSRNETKDDKGNKLYSVCCETKDYEVRFFPSYEQGYRSLARVLSKVLVDKKHCKL